MTNYPSLILLAGGQSSRMGMPKGLLDYKGFFWMLEQLKRFNGNRIYIGLGFDYQQYFDAIPWLEQAIKQPQKYLEKTISVVVNPKPELGSFSTLQEVLKSIVPQTNIWVCPIDVPMLNKDSQKAMLSAKNLVVIPSYKEKKGHPVFIDKNYWKTFIDIDSSADESRLDLLVQKLKPANISKLEVADSACIKNLNTPADWQAFVTD